MEVKELIIIGLINMNGGEIATTCFTSGWAYSWSQVIDNGGRGTVNIYDGIIKGTATGGSSNISGIQNAGGLVNLVRRRNFNRA